MKSLFYFTTLTISMFWGYSAHAMVHFESHDLTNSVHISLDLAKRLNSLDRLHLRIRIPSESTQFVQFWLGQEYLDSVDIVNIQPVPERIENDKDRVAFTMHVPAGLKFLDVDMDVKMSRIGILDGRVGRESNRWLSFTQVVAP